MPRFPSLPPQPVLGDVFKRFPAGAAALLEYHDVVLRGPSPLTVGEREMIAAYVSGLNACAYCHGAHQVIAEIHGIDPTVLAGLVSDPASAGVAARLLPVLAYVRKLTLTPGRMVDADAAAVFAAGWSEEALFHAVSICALFNFMNRIVEGCGVQTDEGVRAEQRARHLELKDDSHTYASFGRRIGLT
ncbi:MAG: peroxidase-related enzyme [Steroidobacteraceae bacterium]